MIDSKAALKKFIKYEKEKYGVKNGFSFYFAGLFGLFERAIIWRYQKKLRRYEYHFNKKHKIRSLFCRIRLEKLGRKFGFNICPNNFDIGLHIMHLGPILVNPNTRIGKDCSIHINTAFVATNGSSDSPKIGDRLKIGVGSTVVGGVSLGNDIVIGAGAVVTKSFEEDHITLGGVPAKIISHKAVM